MEPIGKNAGTHDVKGYAEKIAILGMGHVGLPTALMFAELGMTVIGADASEAKIEELSQGQCTFFEPGITDLLVKHLRSSRLTLTADVPAAIRAANVLFICVGTPQDDHGDADLSQVESLARVIARNLNGGYKLIVEKSTVPAITGQWIRKTIQKFAIEKNNGSNGSHSTPDFDVASNPEFLKEGTAMHDCFNPDRIVCGVDSLRARRILEALYSPLKRPIIFTNVSTAELIKHSANAFLAMKISFINMVADICETVQADVCSVAEGIGTDPRIGPAFLQSGIGYGGYCLPKDVRAFRRLAESRGVDARLLEAIESVNESRVPRLVKKLKDALWVLNGKTVAVLGLSFKEGTDDMRGATSVRVIEELVRENVKVRAFDPAASVTARAALAHCSESISFENSAYEAVKDAHALLILTGWREFRELDFRLIHELMQSHIVLDGRNILDSSMLVNLGFEYLSIGRPAVVAELPIAEPILLVKHEQDIAPELKGSALVQAVPTGNAA
jgi:UDPglucose 6-dehydrogenase